MNTFWGCEPEALTDLSTVFADGGDRIRLLRERILDEGSAHLSALLTAVYRRMDHQMGESFHLVLAGGCMKNRDYAKRVEEKLPFELRQAILPESGQLTPAEGGLRLALRAAGERLLPE